MLPLTMGIMERGVRGLFSREFLTRQRKAKYPRFSTIADSNKQEEKYAMISTLPQLAELQDERVLAGFSEYDYTIRNKVYTTGIRVPRRLFEYDQTGQLRTLVQSLGARVANFPDKLSFALLGSNGICFDKTPMFGNLHDLGNGVLQSNVVNGSMTNDILMNLLSSGATAKDNRDNAVAAMQMDLNNAKRLMFSFEDDRGEPWHEEIEPEGLIIVCPPGAEFFWRTVTEAALIQQTSNVFIKQVSAIITTNRPEPFMDSTGVVRQGTAYLMKTDTPVQPLIFQRFGARMAFDDSVPESDHEMLRALTAVEVQSVMRTGQDISEFTFFNDEFLFGARTHYSVGYGMWTNAVKIVAADAL